LWVIFDGLSGERRLVDVRFATKATEARKYLSSDPRREGFHTLFQIHSLAAETAEETLDRTERMHERQQYADIRAAVVRFNARPALLSVSAFRPVHDVTGKKLHHDDWDCRSLDFVQ
jgi:hypothetical protein